MPDYIKGGGARGTTVKLRGREGYCAEQKPSTEKKCRSELGRNREDKEHTEGEGREEEEEGNGRPLHCSWLSQETIPPRSSLNACLGTL